MLRPIMESMGKFYLGHLGKVPVYASPEAFLLPIFVLYLGQGLSFDKLLMLFMAFVLVILLHELGHALVALAQGMLGVSITISALGGYCSYSGDTIPGRQLLISLAGPFTNLILAWITWLALNHAPITDDTMFFFFSTFFNWNLILGIFNLLPIYPLDGGQATLSIARMLGREFTARKVTLGLSFVFAFVALGFFTLFSNGNLPFFSIAIVGMLLYSAYRDLR